MNTNEKALAALKSAMRRLKQSRLGSGVADGIKGINEAIAALESAPSPKTVTARDFAVWLLGKRIPQTANIREWEAFVAPFFQPTTITTPAPAGQVGDAIEALTKAQAEVERLCSGERWRMTIPANEQRDSDIIISTAITKALEALRQPVETAGKLHVSTRATTEVGDPLFALRAQPQAPVVDDIILQEVYSLREKLKIAVCAIKELNPDFDSVLFLHQSGSADFDQVMEDLSPQAPVVEVSVDKIKELFNADFTGGFERIKEHVDALLSRTGGRS